MKNPNWILDELILALDVYIAGGRKAPGDNDPAIHELSSLLNKFWQAETNKLETLRNANGIHMKIMNFMRLDPTYTQGGRVVLSRGSKLEEIIWHEYADAPEKLSQVAKAIRVSITNEFLGDGLASRAFEDGYEAEEGKILSRLHFQRERSTRIVKAKKAKQLGSALIKTPAAKLPFSVRRRCKAGIDLAVFQYSFAQFPFCALPREKIQLFAGGVLMRADPSAIRKT